MKKSIILLFTVLLLSSFGSADIEYKCKANGDSVVYICTGPYAKKYHSRSDCRGLNNCSGKVSSISLSEAQKTKTACSICY